MIPVDDMATLVYLRLAGSVDTAAQVSPEFEEYIIYPTIFPPNTAN